MHYRIITIQWQFSKKFYGGVSNELSWKVCSLTQRSSDATHWFSANMRGLLIFSHDSEVGNSDSMTDQESLGQDKNIIR